MIVFKIPVKILSMYLKYYFKYMYIKILPITEYNKKLSYRKDDCAMCPIYETECPENFRESLTMHVCCIFIKPFLILCPRVLFTKLLMGFSSD